MERRKDNEINFKNNQFNFALVKSGESKLATIFSVGEQEGIQRRKLRSEVGQRGEHN